MKLWLIFHEQEVAACDDCSWYGICTAETVKEALELLHGPGKKDILELGEAIMGTESRVILERSSGGESFISQELIGIANWPKHKQQTRY